MNQPLAWQVSPGEWQPLAELPEVSPQPNYRPTGDNCTCCGEGPCDCACGVCQFAWNFGFGPNDGHFRYPGYLVGDDTYDEFTIGMQVRFNARTFEGSGEQCSGSLNDGELYRHPDFRLYVDFNVFNQQWLWIAAITMRRPDGTFFAEFSQNITTNQNCNPECAQILAWYKPYTEDPDYPGEPIPWLGLAVLGLPPACYPAGNSIEGPDLFYESGRWYRPPAGAGDTLIADRAVGIDGCMSDFGWWNVSNGTGTPPNLICAKNPWQQNTPPFEFVPA